MSCNIPICEGVKKASDCKCYGAVMRAYGSLIKAGQPERTALEAAQIIYSYHHPEDSKHDAHLTVESWVHAGHAH